MRPAFTLNKRMRNGMVRLQLVADLRHPDIASLSVPELWSRMQADMSRYTEALTSNDVSVAQVSFTFKAA